MYARVCRNDDTWYMSTRDEEKLTRYCPRCGAKMFLLHGKTEEEMTQVFGARNKVDEASSKSETLRF
jgi:hypothetical protein